MYQSDNMGDMLNQLLNLCAQKKMVSRLDYEYTIIENLCCGI